MKILSNIFIICLLSISNGYTEGLLEIDSESLFNSEEFLEQTFKPPDVPLDFVLEKPIDPESYIVGPGDLLQIGIWGDLPITLSLPIMADGVISVPKVGVFDLRNKTLAECSRILSDGVGKYYKFDNFSVNLARPRYFRAMVLGDIVAPGGYIISGGTRLVDLLAAAGGINTRGSWQRITIHHESGDSSIYNLLDFYLNHNDGSNPFIQQGDCVIIPQITQAVEFRGALQIGTSLIPLEQENSTASTLIPIQSQRSLFYEFGQGETVRTLLSTFRNFGVDADLRHLLYEYQENGRSEKRIINLIDPVGETRDSPLIHGGTITAPKIEDVVYVTGDVARPGAYPYSPNLSLSDYIGLAGGLDSRYGSGSGWKLINSSGNESTPDKTAFPYRGDTIKVPRRFSVTLQEYLSPVIGVASVVISAIALSSL